ncbi:2-amino-3-carboxymuconate-6-semialdehyde decarboxylase [Daldinia decipiens]|uniref:2-amino-3-carboxymuconate-6-semialdehyde decarboxylase n=1 Tax=Daldinia decipiens TaxID=326647 RepID=UPI0020C5A4AF|nr:2-amino-3-carboxymuconate-6-semialdehyde decarboxylase [Daldinia decipiens]KAI1657689.1 2-amino-3-carboxymuconate-6-semialdehyde decarboxylase [Daldinia decipiens]
MALPVSGTNGSGLINTHIHVTTPSYLKAVSDTGGDPSGRSNPAWTLEDCVRFCDTIGEGFSVLSLPTPGPSILGPTEAGRKLTRTVNNEVWEVCSRAKGRFGFFASLPDFNDVEGTLKEIKHIFEAEKKANGVIVLTSYGERLLGDEHFRPIWESLENYKALVFVHPTTLNITPEKVGGYLPAPVIDFPHATTRAVVSLLVSGIATACPNVDIILSHAGGTIPFIAQRAIGFLAEPTLQSQSHTNVTESKHALGRFYYDIALSTSNPQLKALLAFSSPSNVLFGTDYPYAPKRIIYEDLLLYSNFVASEEGKGIRPACLSKNAIALLQKHEAENTFLPMSQEIRGSKEPEFGLESNQVAEQARHQLAKLDS